VRFRMRADAFSAQWLYYPAGEACFVQQQEDAHPALMFRLVGAKQGALLRIQGRMRVRFAVEPLARYLVAQKTLPAPPRPKSADVLCCQH